MLGQPVSMLLPQVIGVRLTGQLPRDDGDRSGADDHPRLRQHGVVGKFVEFFGEACSGCRWPTGHHRQHAPSTSTCGLFPIDAETLRYLRFSAARRKSRPGRAYAGSRVCS